MPNHCANCSDTVKCEVISMLPRLYPTQTLSALQDCSDITKWLMRHFHDLSSCQTGHNLVGPNPSNMVDVGHWTQGMPVSVLVGRWYSAWHYHATPTLSVSTCLFTIAGVSDDVLEHFWYHLPSWRHAFSELSAVWETENCQVLNPVNNLGGEPL